MSLTTTDSHQITTVKTSKMQSATVNNRVILGVCAFSVSFGLSLVPKWDITQALITAIISLLATYSAALVVDKRRRNYELLVLNSLHRKIRELEGLKSRLTREIEQVEKHKIILYTESQNLQNQVVDSRNQRDIIHRDLGNFAGQRKQLELEVIQLKTELDKLDNSTAELKKYCSELGAEKRRLEMNANVARVELNQVQAQIEAFKQERQELENNLILSNRIKPQIEEKLHQLRLETEKLETKLSNQKNLLQDNINSKANIEIEVKKLTTKKQSQQLEIQELENQVSLLQEERDLLQNQVWELLQNLENLNSETLIDITENENIDNDENEQELFPFDELLETIKTEDHLSQELPSEWHQFIEEISLEQITILKAIVEKDDIKKILKQIAETQITMPNLLIDGINEIADNTIGEIIIITDAEQQEIYPEHLENVKQVIKVMKV